jgi:branched-chain amino acid transport system ATP-binding protein
VILSSRLSAKQSRQVIWTISLITSGCRSAEPVAGVHPELCRQILKVLKEFRQRGKLIVFIEHDFDAVVQASELMIVMDHGKIIAQGHSKEVIGRPEIMEAYVA